MARLMPACLILSLLLCACSGLGGEPDIIATFAPSSPSASSASISDNWQPNLANGRRIFAEHCTDCHGISGDGQGDLVLAGSVSAPLDMTDWGLTRGKSPLDWFTIIGDGNIEMLMPPWQNALSAAERWDVTIFSYALAYDAEVLAEGARLWTARCADCELPAVIPPVKSDEDYGKTLNQNLFAAELDAGERAAVAAYARMRSLANKNDAVSPAETAADASKVGDIRGRVQHGSQGGLVPSDPSELLAQLRYGSAEIGFSIAETPIDADGNFVFSDIPINAEHSYVIGVIYAGRVFSRLLPDGVYEQTITIYDLTHDPAVISVAAIELFINPMRLEPHGTGLYITQLIRYQNDSDRIFTSGRGFEDGREASLLLQFPAGAEIMSAAAPGRYVLIEDLENVPDSLIDTLPVAPGSEHKIQVEYFLPYDNSLDFEQAFNNRIDGEFSLTLPNSLSAASAELNMTLGESETENVKVYAGWLNQKRDPRLRFEITGNPFAKRLTASDDSSLLTGDSLLAALMALAAAGAALAGSVFWRRRKPVPAAAINSLAKQIAQLDDEHDRGQINHDLYHQRRRELKAKLAELMSLQER